VGQEHNDSGTPARFFKTCEQDNLCSLCYSPLSKSFKYEESYLSMWKNTLVTNAEKRGWTTPAIIDFTAQLDVMLSQNKQLALNVKSAGNLCDSCGTHIALALVGIKTLVFNEEGLQVILDYIGNSKRCTLIQNLVSFAELWENIDTTPTIKSLSLLFGSVNPATINYIPEIERLETSPFVYQAKASKDERTTSNNHPTVKPLALMQYLIKLASREGQIVLDPFLGSGTTALAAKELRRGFIGFELSQDYVDIANKRLSQKVMGDFQ
jgi:hypothetical protein